MANFNLDNYIPVNERLALFYKDFPNGRIVTELIEHSPETGFVMFKASAYRQPDDAAPSATGHAFEERTAGYVNKTSYIENCETSAVGRSLALLGYEIQKSIASREEIEKVKRYDDGNHASQKQQLQAKQPPQAMAKQTDAPTYSERIQNAVKAITELQGTITPLGENESEKDYLASLGNQYKTLMANKQKENK